MQNNRRETDTGKRWAHQHTDDSYRLTPTDEVMTYSTEAEGYECLREDFDGDAERQSWYSVVPYNETK